ncbi:MAG TPA: DUF2017 domain-containing protein [Nocardioidaceae bacterium]|nr:DUF2017 domain-containing protein [Nocardioidaceae bacterium]
MTEGFQPRRGGGAVATFNGFEADLLRSLASQLVELLRNEVAAPVQAEDPLEDLLDFDGPTSAPDDPVLARLFPNAYPADDDAAGEFRRFTEGGLRDGKVRAAMAIVDALEEAGLPEELDEETLYVDVELGSDEALAWVKSFTDIRLALATRLGVEEGDENYWHTLPDDDPRTHVHEIYEWVGYLQETLVESLAP